MRFNREKHYGALKRKKTRWLWFPKKIDGELRWLEWASWWESRTYDWQSWKAYAWSDTHIRKASYKNIN